MLVTVQELQTYMDITFGLRQTDAAEFVLEGLQSELEGYLRRPVQLVEVTETHVIPTYFQGIPATSFFYDYSQGTTGESVDFIQPSVIINLRNTPVVSVKSVSVTNMSQAAIFFAEAKMRVSNITNAVQTGTNVTFTSQNSFTLGQRVVIENVVPSIYNKSAMAITAVTATSFTVGDYAAGMSAYVSGGKATATGNDYTVQRFGLELYRGFPNDEITVVYTGGLDGEAIKMMKLFITRAATREMQNMHDDVVGVKDLTTRGVAPLETGFSERELLALRRWRRRRI